MPATTMKSTKAKSTAHNNTTAATRPNNNTMAAAARPNAATAAAAVAAVTAAARPKPTLSAVAAAAPQPATVAAAAAPAPRPSIGAAAPAPRPSIGAAAPAPRPSIGAAAPAPRPSIGAAAAPRPTTAVATRPRPRNSKPRQNGARQPQGPPSANWYPDRRINLAEYDPQGRVRNPDHVTLHYCDRGLSYMAHTTRIRRSGTRELDIDLAELCISVSGFCSKTGHHGPRAAAGVYFGEHSPYNWAGELNPQSNRLTDQTAELFATIRALRIFTDQRVRHGGPWNDIRTVVLITDSEFVFKAMTRYVWRWQVNGWLNAKGLPIVNIKKIQALHNMILDLEASGIRVVLWCVHKNHNTEAIDLAGSFL